MDVKIFGVVVMRGRGKRGKRRGEALGMETFQAVLMFIYPKANGVGELIET